MIRTNLLSENPLRTTGARHMTLPEMNSAVLAVGCMTAGLVWLSTSPHCWFGLLLIRRYLAGIADNPYLHYARKVI